METAVPGWPEVSYVRAMGTRTMDTPGYLSSEEVSVDDLAALVATVTPPENYPHASTIVHEAVVYDMDVIADTISTEVGRREVMAEIAHVLQAGSGIVVLRGAVATNVLGRATEAFEAMIAREKAAGGSAGDHFAAAGANDRVWNALEKLAVADPSVFVDYYASDAIALASSAWLGPAYQVTSQLNVVNPGGTAQSPHRDYHLGFMTDEQAGRYPAHVHGLSGGLTLQGAVAHVDMPVESGPTKLLPHSQKYALGYLAWRRPDVIDFFEEHHVQLPLAAGDAVFFHPALFHAAGTNRTADVRRMANLIQVSSAMGRSMESVDRERMVRAIYPQLVDRAEIWEPSELANAVSAAAEGYPFPSNLDRDPPINGLAPPSQADLVHRALRERWSSEQLGEAFEALATRRQTS